MRKPAWWDLGIVVLGLVLVCGATRAVAQEQAPEEGDAARVEAQQQVELARLRAQVASLEQQLARMRVELARARQAAEGTGGSGTEEGVGGGGSESVAVANVIHTGRVRSVTQQRLVLEEEGATHTLPLARDVRVLRGGQRVALRDLREGTQVRTSADLYARGNPVTRIEVLSPPGAPK